MNKFLKICFITAVTGTLAIGSAVAQDTQQRLFFRNVVVKSGANARFEEFIGKVKEAVEKTDSSDRWYASQNVVGDGNSYIFVTPFSSWELFANPQDVLGDAYSDREVKRVLGLLESSVESMSTAVYTVNQDLSRPAPESDQPNVAVLQYHVTLNSGMDQQFNEFVSKLKEATDAVAQDQYWVTLSPGIGASGPVFVIFAKSWSQFDTESSPVPQRLTEHFGEEEATRLLEMWPSIINSGSSTMNRPRPDLANPPE